MRKLPVRTLTKRYFLLAREYFRFSSSVFGILCFCFEYIVKFYRVPIKKKVIFLFQAIFKHVFSRIPKYDAHCIILTAPFQGLSARSAFLGGQNFSTFR